jgi:Fur family transcriptional regulator, ferric uptake regulator
MACQGSSPDASITPPVSCFRHPRRPIRRLEQEGILSKIELLDHTAHYEINDGAIHCHMICSKCGKITEIRRSAVQRFLKFIQGDSHFEIQQGNVNFYGVCEDCVLQ